MRLISATILLAVVLLGPAHAGTEIELSAEASRPAANDLLRAGVYAESSGADVAELARRTNRDIAEALKLIRGTPAVTVKSGQQNTQPIYDKGQKLENWRIRSELLLETTDAAAMSELLGKLQAMRLALGHLSQLPSPATRAAADEAATRDAIDAFRARAELIAKQFGKAYQIKQLTVRAQGAYLPVSRFQAAGAMLSSSPSPAPMPIEAGESQVTVNVSGRIELSD